MMWIWFIVMLAITLEMPKPSRKLYARVKFTGLISEIRGKLNNCIIQGWKSGVFTVKDMMTSVANPNSPKQDLKRDIVSEMSKAWFETLLPVERAAWETYALTKPGFYAITPGVRELVGSNGGVMSGQNAFVLTNAWLISAGLLAVILPPLGVTPPSKPVNLVAMSVLGVLTVSWEAPEISEPSDVVRVWMSSVGGTFHKQIVGSALVGALTLPVPTITGGKGLEMNVLALAGDHVYIQADTVAAAGGKSGGSNTVELLLTAGL